MKGRSEFEGKGGIMKLEITLSIVLLLLCLGANCLAEPSSKNTFSVVEAGQSNVFLDDNFAQVHLLLRSESRLVFAFPAENTGVGVWFDGAMEIVPGSLESLPPDGSTQQVEVRVKVSRPTVLRSVVLDSIRTLRDESEGAGTVEEIAKARGTVGGKTTQTSSGNAVHFERHQRFLPSDAGQFELHIEPATVDADGRVVLSPGEVSFRAQTPFSAMTRFLPEELYRPSYLADLERTPGRVDDSLRALEFLARREKMMAGSWRFLTYFGRDTLISLAMLEPILSDEALGDGVRSVLTRLSPEGMVSHEEDIGPWAEWRHLQAGESLGMEPVYDHKMIDDDLLLPVLLAKLSENGRGNVVRALLEDPVAKESISKNVTYVLDRLSKKEPLRLNPGESTGDWRDSHEGLGGGVYPASVNAGLAVPTLDALEMLLTQMPEPPEGALEKVRDLKPVWNALQDDYWVELSPAEVAARLANFEKDLTSSRKAGFQKLMNARPDLLEKPFRFPVLSLDDKKSPVVVPHTDVAFTLFYGQPSEKELEDILTLLERPFPYGLATPGGHLVASPVFSTNSEHYKSLGFGQYHGMVVWSWPSAMLQFGLLRQRGRFDKLNGRIASLLEEIEANEKRVGKLATSELWAIDLDENGITWRAYGTAGDQAESNALQLWSTVYPALEWARGKR